MGERLMAPLATLGPHPCGHEGYARFGDLGDHGGLPSTAYLKGLNPSRKRQSQHLPWVYGKWTPHWKGAVGTNPLELLAFLLLVLLQNDGSPWWFSP